MASTPVTPTSSLGSPSHSTLPSLKTVALQPKRHAQPLRMDTALQQIDQVEVAKVANQDDTEKDPLYVINLFFVMARGGESTQTPHNKSMQPTQQTLTQRSSAIRPSMAETETETETKSVPDLQVVHKLSEFAALRDKIHVCVRPIPREDPTAFCSELTEFLSYSSARAAVFERSMEMPTANASPLLVTFLQRTLDGCKDLLHSHPRTSCRGERHALALMFGFLYPIRSLP